MLKIIGYSDQISVQAGEWIRFFVHSEESSYTARLVKIRSGDINPVGPGLKVKEIPCSVNGKYRGIKQSIHAGSYAVIPISDQQLISLQSFEETFEVEFYIFPTTPDRGSQYLIDLYHHTLHHGLYLKLTSQGVIEARFGNGSHHATLKTTLSLTSHVWHRIAFSFDRGKCSLKQQTLDHYHEHLNQSVSTTTNVTKLKFPDRPLFFAGKLSIVQDSFEKQIGTEIFNGKLDSISFSHKKKKIAEWDFAKEIPTTHIKDTGPLQLHGRLENLPTRGVTGYRYTGEETSWESQPDSYSAIYFHDDDLYDAKWQESFQ
jgi:N,N-dimethylformamidase